MVDPFSHQEPTPLQTYQEPTPLHKNCPLYNASPAQRPAIDSARAATADSATVIRAVTKTRAASTEAPVTANHPCSIHIKVAG